MNRKLENKLRRFIRNEIKYMVGESMDLTPSGMQQWDHDEFMLYADEEYSDGMSYIKLLRGFIKQQKIKVSPAEFKKLEDAYGDISDVL